MGISYKEIFYHALRVRMVEEKIREIYPSDKIQSPVHLSLGQEHHIAALLLQLKKTDQVYTSYRSHAVYLAKGGNLKQMFAELYGKKSGVAKGKAGSMHLCAPESGMMGSSAIVGSPLPHALGAAYAMKIKKSGNIAVSITGDGSCEEGVFSECLNFAALKSLPVLYVIENNGLAIHAPIKERQSFGLKKLSEAYGIEHHLSADGSDMKAVAALSAKIINSVRKKQKPAVYEILTCRYKEHVGINEDFHRGYRSRADFQKKYCRDPLVTEKNLINKFSKKIYSEIDRAAAYAEESEFPGPGELLKDVY
jgi:TPP-dependent pyruvate/acetoin dehydrogenase alpha subunit